MGAAQVGLSTTLGNGGERPVHGGREDEPICGGKAARQKPHEVGSVISPKVPGRTFFPDLPK